MTSFILQAFFEKKKKEEVSSAWFILCGETVVVIPQMIRLRALKYAVP